MFRTISGPPSPRHLPEARYNTDAEDTIGSAAAGQSPAWNKRADLTAARAGRMAGPASRDGRTGALHGPAVEFQQRYGTDLDPVTRASIAARRAPHNRLAVSEVKAGVTRAAGPLDVEHVTTVMIVAAIISYQRAVYLMPVLATPWTIWRCRSRKRARSGPGSAGGARAGTLAFSLRAVEDGAARNALRPGQPAWAAAAKLPGSCGSQPSQSAAVGFADSAARRYSALMRRASSSWSSRMTMRQAASTGVPWSTSSRARAAMRSW